MDVFDIMLVSTQPTKSLHVWVWAGSATLLLLSLHHVCWVPRPEITILRSLLVSRLLSLHFKNGYHFRCSHKKIYILTLFLMFFFQSLDCTAMYPHIQIFRSGCICYLKVSSWRKRFLSASFEQENCQSSIHQIKDFASFVSGSVTWEERFARSISMQLPGRQRFFKAGPGDQIMTNEVQVNVTGGGSWWETGPI